MLCPTCNRPLKAATSRDRTRVAIWACVTCQFSTPRKMEAYQRKLPGLDPGLQRVAVTEDNKQRRRKGEHLMQCTLFDQIRRHEAEYPILHAIFAVPNGGFRPINVAKEMVREGVRKGVPDIIIPVASRGYHGFCIELKMPDGVTSKHQEWFHAFLKNEGYRVIVCRSWEEAWGEILWYLNLRIGMGTKRFVREMVPAKAA